MSKRPSSNDKVIPPAAIKKPRLEMDASVVEVKVMCKEFLDTLKVQKNNAQWGHANGREDIAMNIKKAETLVSAVTKLEKDVESTAVTAQKFVEAMIDTEIDYWVKIFEQKSAANICCDEDPDAYFADYVIHRDDQQIRKRVIKKVKEQVKGDFVDELPTEIKKETKIAFLDVMLQEVTLIIKRQMEMF